MPPVPPVPAPEVPPRRLTTVPLPPYRYVPGGGPHPFRHPDGHAWNGGAAPEPTPWTHGPWWRDHAWLHAIDLFNHRYYWEAHEVLEGMWRQVPRTDPLREVVQGLVQLAAALLLRHLGRATSAEQARTAALRRLRSVGTERVHGLDLGDAIAAAEAAGEAGTWPVLPLGAAREVPMAIRVVAAAIVSDGRVLAARRRPDRVRGGLWELPGGKVEPGEDDRVALAREIAEELGLVVRVGDWLADAVHDYGDVKVHLVAYACAHEAGEPALTDHDAVAWLGADELDTVAWAPADVPLLEAVRSAL